MIYCKYCYRMLEDGTEVCTACGKSQEGYVKRQKTFFGLFPVYKEKDLSKAKEAFFHAEAVYKLAKETSTILEFTLFWNMLIKDNAILRTYQDLISPSNFLELSSILDKEDEFQWRLRDAVERSAKNAISDIKGEYRNNIRARVEAFADDVNYATDLADLETSEFILSKLYEVADFAKVELPSNIQQSNRSPMLDEFARYGGIDAELLSVDLMEGHDFEHWCADLLRDSGYANVSVTPGSGDQGVDILAEKDGLKYAVQCKRYSSDLGNTPVQEVHAGKYIYHAHVAAVITNQHFTAGAKELAAATGVLLWDRDWITNCLKQQERFSNAIPPVVSAQSEHKAEIINADLEDMEGDEMFPDAVDVILETGQASVSMLQRRLKLGYARTARIVDEMEEKGIVGPFQGSTPRAILITKEQWQFIRLKYK